MSQNNAPHAWWSRLRHQGLLLSPVVMVERYASTPPAARFPLLDKLRYEFNRFDSYLDGLKENVERDEAAILKWTDAVLEKYVQCGQGQIAKQHAIAPNLTAPVRIANRTETLRPHRVVFADPSQSAVALLVMADTSPHVGRGRGRNKYAQFLELLRGTGHRLGLLTNGSQFRLIYAGIDFESWCEWESDRWFDGGEGTEELDGLRQLLSPESLAPAKSGISSLLDVVEESRKRQADLSSVLRENVRQAVELLLEDVSTAHRTKSDLFAALMSSASERRLTDAQAHEALLQATVRIVMRLVVCLFAESRQLLPVNDPIYAQAYGVRSLYELLDEATRNEGGTHVLFNRQMAWSRLMALFRLIHGGSSHGAFAMRAYGGALFRPGDAHSPSPVDRALHILEHAVSVGDATVYHVLRRLLRGPLPVVKGHQKTFVDGPVDYTDLRTEFIGLIYEGLLDYRLKRTDEQTGPQVFLNLGREPVLPLARLRDMLENDRKGLKDLLTTLRKEKVTASVAAEEEEAEEEAEEQDEAEEESTEEVVAEPEAVANQVQRPTDYMDAVEAAKQWAREAVVLAALVGKQGKKESDSEYQTRIEAEATRLINRVVAPGEFYLVRAGNTRKGTGTFYTRPQLAVPTVHRTLEPLCYTKSPLPPGEGQGEGGDSTTTTTLVPKTPEEILSLKVCDPACGSASFLVAALHYLTEALYKSLCHHRKLDDPSQAKRVTLPYGRPKNGIEGDELLPFPPDDPNRGEMFADRVKALLRRHVVERCIYGVDINPLAVELARVSLWVETLDPDLPFSFLDHKIKVGNSLVGCWLDRVEDYPLKAWEREGGDGKDGPRTQRIEEFLKGEKIGKRRTGDGQIKKEMREVIESRFNKNPSLFPEMKTTTNQVIAEARLEYEKLHSLPIGDPDQRERFYREHVQASPALQHLKQAMNEWCAVWFWHADEESLKHVPTPLTFHAISPLAPSGRGAGGEGDQRPAIIARLAEELKFLHWELEFPDVFTPERAGFDAMIGNPPWDVIEPKSQEFFTEFDPLYRTYDQQAALRKQQELFGDVPGVADWWDQYNAQFKALGNWAKNVAQPFDVTLARGKQGASLATLWAAHRSQAVGYANAEHPFRQLGSGKQNAFKLFTEAFWSLLKHDGRLGIILPTGIYSDFGTKDLREELLDRGRIDFLYAFQNEKRVFSAAHHAFKQVVLLAARGGRTETFLARFRMGVGDSPHAHEIPDDLLRYNNLAMTFTPDDVRRNSPKSLSLIELRSPRDLAIFRTIYDHSFRMGDNAPGWEITYAQEFNMTTDSKHFPPLEKWEAKGFQPDVFGRWLNSDCEIAVPLYEGRMVGQFDAARKGWVSGKGRTAIWRDIPFDAKQIEPQFLVGHPTYSSWPKAAHCSKVGCMDVTASTNSRTFIGSVIHDFPANHKTPTLVFCNGDLCRTLLAVGVLNGFVFDCTLRARLSGLSLGWFILEECPVPSVVTESVQHRIVLGSARLNLIHRHFAGQWLCLEQGFGELSSREWKHWWAVTEADRLRLRVEIDALCADLYGLDPDDFDWIVRDDRTDPKGFYRVDKALPFRERLTGLAAAAFRALKDGKWSAESAASLSNDDFFDILGIPELTNADAAKAKGLPGPLILARDGCHVWRPENFPPDDPRHGWTWDDCRKDAVALLGSEEAVEKYIAEKPQDALTPGPSPQGRGEEVDEPFQLKAKKPRQRQKKIF